MLKDYFKKLTTKDSELSPKGYYWIFIVFLLVSFSFSVAFFNRGRDLDVSIPSNISDGLNDREPRIYSVLYKNNNFSPTNLRIRIGDSVRFENEGLFSIRIVSDDLSGFDSIGSIPPSGIFTYTFAKTGIFGYYNERNINESGKVIVR